MDNLIDDESENIKRKRISAANSIQLTLKMTFYSEKNKALSRKISLEAITRKGIINEMKVIVLFNAQILRNHELHFNDIGKPFQIILIQNHLKRAQMLSLDVKTFVVTVILLKNCNTYSLK